ncbi:MAG: adenylate/guanylate cyclase domain-containing protein [Pyrinomonadaceae bacterium]
MPREFHYRWEFDLRSSPEQLWPLVANTNRFNRDTGVPPVEDAGNGKDAVNARRHLRLFVFGLPVEWEEQPFEWIKPYRFGVVRRYIKGPMAEMRVLAELAPKADGGTHLTFQVFARPKSLLGAMAIPAQIGIVSKRSFAAAFRRYDQIAAMGQPALIQSSEQEFAPGGRERLELLGQKLRSQISTPALADKLIESLARADAMTLSRLRPFAIADYWQAPRKEVLAICLQATRIGLLDLQWELICPHCRGAAQTASSLAGVHSQAKCAGCNIDFTVNFDRSVELTFRPNPSIRQVETRSFCMGGPEVTPHVIAQQLIPAGTERELQLPLEEGRYRLRTLALPGGQSLAARADGSAELTLQASAAGWPGDELQVSLRPSLRFENNTECEQLFILERTAWGDQAATAAEVTALQVFRDLFANEALRPGDQISVGSLTVLFTDLRNSTQMYREIGDATAFGHVMNHFDVLKQAIAEEDGALVKTIGDAVMAVFRRPASALRAMLKVQQTLASPPEGTQRLTLKAGLHTGPCIAVTLNDRLDYFGSTVNMAARLEALSNGSDVIISAEVCADPEVKELLANPATGLIATRFEVPLKGFLHESFELWRVAPATDAGQ